MFKNILLTGSEGFIGSYIKEIFKKKKNKIYFFNKKKLDITNKQKLNKHIKSNLDLIIHAAALCGAEESERRPNEFINTNFLGTVNLLEVIKKKKVKNFIFISSLTVFGESNKKVNENSPFNGKHVYSKTKIMAEYFLKVFCEVNNINYIILRPSLVVGPRMKELHALGDFCKKLKYNKTLNLFGKANHKRDYIHPTDVARCIYKLSKYLFNNQNLKISEDYNLSNNEAISMRSLALKIKKFYNSGSLKFVKKNKQTFSLFADNKKIMENFNFKCQYSNSQIIKDITCQI